MKLLACLEKSNEKTRYHYREFGVFLGLVDGNNGFLRLPDNFSHTLYLEALTCTQNDIITYPAKYLFPYNMNDKYDTIIITNKTGVYGSGALMFMDIFRHLCYQQGWKTGCYIVQASIHRLIAVNRDSFTSIKELNKLIYISDDEERYRLSDEVFIYDAESNQLL